MLCQRSSSICFTPGLKAAARCLSIEPRNFHKFPRTQHLYNLGAATKDDRVFADREATTFLAFKIGHTLVVQEKIDGSNMGLSVDPETFELKAQNRSGYVTTRSHPQYSKLWFWLDSHRESLWNILTANGSLPGAQLIMYGEWLAAKHSIHYTRLPDTFLAFDILDVAAMRFYSYSRLRKLLQGTSIHSVPLVAEGDTFTKKELLQMIGRKSCCYDGLVEGVYVRQDSDDSLIERAKVVRPDFTSGNEQWDRGQITANLFVQEVNTIPKK